jgi:hypothetical protein
MIKQIEMDKLEGLKIRSKIQWREEGETCSKFFANLEKHNAEKKLMDTLTTPEGTL